MTDLYTDEKYIKATLGVVEDDLEDLEKISVYNNDKMLAEISDIKQKFFEVRKGLLHDE